VTDDADAGWKPIEGIDPPLEDVDLDDLDLLAQITHPTRSVIMRHMKDPRTVAEVAADLGVPVTRLYHHVNKLEQLGLIRVVATRQVAAVTERRYQVVGRSFRVSPELLQSSDERELVAAFGSLFDVAKLSLQRWLESGSGNEFPERGALLTLSEFHLTPQRRYELVERMRALISEFGDEDDEGDDAQTVTFFASVFRETS